MKGVAGDPGLSVRAVLLSVFLVVFLFPCNRKGRATQKNLSVSYRARARDQDVC